MAALTVAVMVSTAILVVVASICKERFFPATLTHEQMQWRWFWFYVAGQLLMLAIYCPLLLLVAILS